MFWCNVGFADAASVKKACRDLGFEPGTELFLDCALKLMSQEKQSAQNITLKKDKKKGESFNKKYNTFADFFKKKEGSSKDKKSKDKKSKDKKKRETFHKKNKTLVDIFKKAAE